ncbi:kinase-like protein [Coniophora puteana RWD-64-598 SS2]|uniref:Kinase-like protein n=1 Tax=Coniophora puteana (strain RWD-64-598) TaxID=741705 RepID=A0A5M3M7W6_CONPW|nr:kinase-like protein [Coniophora puteana RWD-64-598 SS2]EIW74885.1 kinase-like protein [Coniophora puteana RWD-64-598 SS2]
MDFELLDPTIAFSDQYMIGENIGSSSFGIVYKAKRLATEKEYAVKVLRKLPFRPHKLRNAPILKEVLILQNLGHTNIVNLHAAFESKKEIYLVMEFMRHGDLESLIQKYKGLDESVSKTALNQICDGLEYLHCIGIVHRDVKPPNVLVAGTTPLRLKLTDFGISKVVNDTTFMRTLCGTPMYMAPEIYAPGAGVDHHYDRKVDSWSLGVTLFKMLVHLSSHISAVIKQIPILKEGRSKTARLSGQTLPKVGPSPGEDAKR